jgi:hypothetical protein
VNVSEQYDHGIKALLGMIVFLLSLMRQLKECDPLMLPTFDSFFLSHMRIYTILVPWCIGFHASGTTQMKTLVYGW